MANNENIATAENPVFDWKSMSFELPNAVPLTEDGKAVSALPGFNINNAIPEDNIQNARPNDTVKGPNAQLDEVGQRIENVGTNLSNFFNRMGIQASKAVFDLKNTFPSVLTQFDKANSDVKNIANFPDRIAGENNDSYNKRLAEFDKIYQGEQIAKGPLGQLDTEMQAGLAIAAPTMTLAHWGTLIGGMGLMQGEKYVQDKFAPDVPKGINNLIELGVMAGSFKMSHEAVNGIGDFLGFVLNKGGKSPIVDIPSDIIANLKGFDSKVGDISAEPGVTARPKPFVKMSQEGWPAQDVETPTGTMSGGVLDKLGISQDHAEASINHDLPVRIPVSTLLGAVSDLSKSAHWEDIKQLMTFEGEGGPVETPNPEVNSKTEINNVSPETQPVVSENASTTSEKALSSVQGDIKTIESSISTNKAEEPLKTEPSDNTGTSKIARSINQKAIEQGLTDQGFDKIAGYDKVTVKDQAEKAAKLTEDVERTRRILRGEEKLPEGHLDTPFIIAVENLIKTHPDRAEAKDIAAELVNSDLVSGTSRHAQELRMMAERSKSEAETALKKAQDLKKAKIEKAGGDEKVTKAKKDFVKKAKAEMDKIHLSKEELSMDKFLDGIKC
jgi:hypothetical protein